MLTLFSWGYWGWGSTTRQLIQAVDATETARGYKPPVFIDIRIRRNVRAKGFSGAAFERVLGDGRYVWERRLGNAAVAAGEDGIRIADPSAAKDLLGTARRLSSERRRVLFFCSCEFPRGCHRSTVANLVLRAAEDEGRSIEIVEWPGETPKRKTIPIAQATFKAVLRGRQSVPLGEDVNLSEVGCLPWGSIVRLDSGQAALLIVTGPAKYQNGWVLPILAQGNDLASLTASSARVRKEKGMEPKGR